MAGGESEEDFDLRRVVAADWELRRNTAQHRETLFGSGHDELATASLERKERKRAARNTIGSGGIGN